MQSKTLLGRMAAVCAVLTAGAALGAAPSVTVTAFDAATGVFTLALGAAAEADTWIFAASADEDRGATTAGWELSRCVRKVSAGETACTGVLPRAMTAAAKKVRFFAVSPDGLPGTRLQYMTSTGSGGSAGSYINTGIVPDKDTAIKISAKYSCDMAPFGVAGVFYQFCNSKTAMPWNFMGKGSTGALTSPGTWDGAFHVYELSKDAMKLDGKVYDDAHSSGTSSASAPIALFGRHSNSATPSIAKLGVCSIQYAVISKKGAVVGDFVPYEKDGVCFLYDRVTKNSFENQNASYPFTAGPETDPDLADASAFSTSAVCATAGDAVTAAVSDIAVSQDGKSHQVKVAYTLTADAPVIVTAQMLTNDAPVAGAELIGDVCRELSAGRHEFFWKPDTEIPGLASLPVKARMQVWSTNAPPAYIVFDIRSGVGGDGKVDVPRHYVAEADLPGGIDSDRYRTSHLAMRRINARGVTFRMGTPKEAADAGVGKETHYVTFSNDFYIGVFEFTQGQYLSCMTNANPSLFRLATDNQHLGRPLEYLSFNQFRCSWSVAERGREVYELNPVGRLRALTGGVLFDVPTEAQWEFACRAGTSTVYYWGDKEDTTLSRCVRNPSGNSTTAVPTSAAPTTTTEKGTARVGSSPANPWGLYDMYGNVWEMCLDVWSAEPAAQNTPATAVVEPCRSGAQSGTRVRRGGGWGANPGTSATRLECAIQANYGIGARVVCPVPCTKAW